MQNAPFSIAKFLDLLSHIWLPALIVGTAGTAGLIRTMRANLLDELPKQYVTMARARGVGPTKLLYKYPLRIAINPVISTIGYALPALVEGELLVSLVLGLPTLAPVLLKSLQQQDMFLASSIVMILALLVLIGTLLSDILLAIVDPRIRGSV
jgi:peptide/nickel transport system permease protein